MTAAPTQPLSPFDAASPRGVWLRAITLVALVLAAYFPVRDAGYVWDDDALLTNNDHMRSVEGLWRTWADPRANLDYYPLMHTSWWLEYRVWELNPLGYHIDNVLLHIAISLLLWRVLVRLRVPGAWLAALLFAIHPVHVESVAWVSQRKNTLSGVFYLATAYCYLRFNERDGAAAPRDASRWRWYAGALALFVAAMLSKPVTMTLAAALPLLAWRHAGKLTRRDLAAVAPFFALVVPMALLTMWVQKHHVGATGPEFEYTLPERIIIAGRVVWFYVGKLLWPRDLTFAYAMWDIKTGAWWQWLYPLSVAAVLVIAWLRRATLGIAPFLAAAYFVITLSPALGIIPIYWHRYYFVADHVQYFADMGLLALAVGLGVTASRRLVPGVRFAATIATGALAVAAVVASHTQATHYLDEETLWRDTLDKNNKAWIAHNNLGLILRTRGDVKEAYPHLVAAREYAPHVPETHHNEGLALLDFGRTREAEAAFRKSLSLKESAVVRCDLGLALAARGRYDDAIAEYERSLAADAGRAKAHYNLGVALALKGDIEAGAKEVGVAMKLDANAAAVRRDLGMQLIRAGKAAAGVPLLRGAVGSNDADAEGLWVLAWELATSADDTVRDGAEALKLAQKGMAVTGGRSPQLMDALAAALAETGDFKAAAAQARTAAGLAMQAREEALAAEITRHSDAYADKRPWRQPPRPPQE